MRVEQTAGQPYITIEIDRRKIARYGINVADVQEMIETAIGGKTATEVFEGERRFELILRFPEEKRNSLEAMGNILVSSPSDLDDVIPALVAYEIEWNKLYELFPGSMWLLRAVSARPTSPWHSRIVL